MVKRGGWCGVCMCAVLMTWDPIIPRKWLRRVLLEGVRGLASQGCWKRVNRNMKINMQQYAAICKLVFMTFYFSMPIIQLFLGDQ
jgi:hypothetical protein